VLDLDPERLQMSARSDARQLQDLGGFDGAAAQQNLFPRLGFSHGAGLAVLDGNGTLTLQQYPMRQRPDFDLQVLTRLGGVQIAYRGRRSTASLDR
jgi:hypothetical protein